MKSKYREIKRAGDSCKYKNNILKQCYQSQQTKSE